MINYEEAIIEARKKAIQSVEIDTKKMQKRCQDWGVECSLNNFAKIYMAKDPLKQNFCEKYFAEQFNLIKPNGIYCIKLPAGGKDAMYPTTNGASKIKPDSITKSLDFIFMKDNKILGYSTNKYTKEGGGAQDNQRNDVRHSLSFKCENVFAICDGEYWSSYIDNKYIFTTNGFINAILNNKILQVVE